MILDEIQKPYSKQIEKLRKDEFYYGDFGRQYLSNSDIGSYLTTLRILEVVLISQR